MKNNFYMASSANGIHESCVVNCCPSAPLGLISLARNFHIWSHIWHVLNPLLTKRCRSRWLDIGPIRFCKCLFIDLDFVRSITTQQNNLTNIQPSSPHAWSITHGLQPSSFGVHQPLRSPNVSTSTPLPWARGVQKLNVVSVHRSVYLFVCSSVQVRSKLQQLLAVNLPKIVVSESFHLQEVKTIRYICTTRAFLSSC